MIVYMLAPPPPPRFLYRCLIKVAQSASLGWENLTMVRHTSRIDRENRAVRIPTNKVL